MADKTSNKAMYSFRMIWRFDAPIEKVWEMINHPEQWPKWWKNCKNVERLREGEKGGVGAVRRFTMQTQLPYRLVFSITSTRSEKPRLLAGDAEGNLAGRVLWQLSQEGPITTVRYNWDVRPTKAWMSLLSPVLRPIFMWNHRSMMRNAGKGLSRMIGARLVSQKYF